MREYNFSADGGRMKYIKSAMMVTMLAANSTICKTGALCSAFSPIRRFGAVFFDRREAAGIGCGRWSRASGMLCGVASREVFGCDTMAASGALAGAAALGNRGADGKYQSAQLQRGGRTRR